jgi:hypothetical protein
MTSDSSGAASLLCELAAEASTTIIHGHIWLELLAADELVHYVKDYIKLDESDENIYKGMTSDIAINDR